MMKDTLEPDPTEAVHDRRCACCNSSTIEFVKDMGFSPANLIWEGKLCQQVKKTLWLCNDCGRTFASNHFITQ
jgi:hypothetical protein